MSPGTNLPPRWSDGRTGNARRILIAAGAAHALHDGLTDLTYVMLPVWQGEFALGYAALALLRGIYAGSMAAGQIPAGRLAERLGGRPVLVLGTAVTALGVALAGFSGNVVVLGACLLLAGIGASTQHPIASAAVSRAYGAAARGPLGTYNFAGDIGKAVIPALAALLVGPLGWRASLWALALLAAMVAGAIALVTPRVTVDGQTRSRPLGARSAGGTGFPLLFAIGVLDSGARMGLLTFLPFLLRDKGASMQQIGLALALVFAGGAAGKAACGWLGARWGIRWTVLATEAGTAAAILALLGLPLAAALALLPLLGMMLNGTSSVLYGTVPELTPPERIERAFALFYLGTIGSGALSPVLFGVVGDAFGPRWATAAAALAALATIPPAMILTRRLVGASAA